MEDYKQLLEKAYENVKPSEECERFEIKKAEGHIQGNQTIINNLGDIARYIRRKPEELAKFLLRELASSGNLKGERLILTRKVSSKDINDKVEKYVKKYVYCPKCKKPDTELVDETGNRYIKCLACGNKQKIG